METYPAERTTCPAAEQLERRTTNKNQINKRTILRMSNAGEASTKTKRRNNLGYNHR